MTIDNRQITNNNQFLKIQMLNVELGEKIVCSLKIVIWNLFAIWLLRFVS